MTDDPVVHLWRGQFADPEVNALHAEVFGHRRLDGEWWARCDGHSLGWVTARVDERLVGFVNVAWDGAVHAFILDTMVSAAYGRRGIGTELVRVAATHARRSRCEWLHVDFEDHLQGFYLRNCGFTETGAGLIAL